MNCLPPIKLDQKNIITIIIIVYIFFIMQNIFSKYYIIVYKFFNHLDCFYQFNPKLGMLIETF